jgi:hypothetical protein
MRKEIDQMVRVEEGFNMSVEEMEKVPTHCEQLAIRVVECRIYTNKGQAERSCDDYEDLPADVVTHEEGFTCVPITCEHLRDGAEQEHDSIGKQERGVVED